MAIPNSQKQKAFTIAATALALICIGAWFGSTAKGAEKNETLNFASNSTTAWVPSRSAGDDFLPPPSGPGPVVSDPNHPYSPNQGTAGQAAFHVADLNNPILKPWAREQMKKSNDEVLAGKIPFTARERCWPGGVPDFDIYERDRPVFWVQSPREVVIVNEHDGQTRHIYLNVPHSPNVKPTWYGDSVGHFEGDTLVVDTVGLDDRGGRLPHLRPGGDGRPGARPGRRRAVGRPFPGGRRRRRRPGPQRRDQPRGALVRGAGVAAARNSAHHRIDLRRKQRRLFQLRRQACPHRPAFGLLARRFRPPFTRIAAQLPACERASSATLLICHLPTALRASNPHESFVFV